MKKSDVEQMKKAWDKQTASTVSGDTVDVGDISNWLSALPVDEEEKNIPKLDEVYWKGHDEGYREGLAYSENQERSRCVEILEEMGMDCRPDIRPSWAICNTLREAADKIRGTK